MTAAHPRRFDGSLPGPYRRSGAEGASIRAFRSGQVRAALGRLGSARPVAGHPHRRKGRARHRRYAEPIRLADLGRLATQGRCRPRRLGPRRRRRRYRQDRHHRVRHPQARPDHEPCQPGPHPRRIVLRVRRRGRRWPVSRSPTAPKPPAASFARPPTAAWSATNRPTA